MSKLCPKCYFIGRGNNGPLNGGFIIGVIFVGIGIYGLTIENFLFGSYAASIGVNVILIGLGIIRIVEHFLGGNVCPECRYKPMLKIATPEAIKLIKEHDFKFKEELSQNPGSEEAPPQP